MQSISFYKISTRYLGLIFLALIGTTTAGCGLVVYKVATDPRTPKDILKDEQIEFSVSRILRADETIQYYDLDVVSICGHVYLAGQVQSEREHVRAIHLVKTIEGVNGVTTAIKIRYQFNEYPNDKELCNRIRFQFVKDMELRWMNLGVHCDNGDVILSGVVRSEREKKLAEKHARERQGTRSVLNHIVIKDSGWRL